MSVASAKSSADPEAIATARAFLERSGATRVVLLLDRGDGSATMIDATAEATEVTEHNESTVIPAEQAASVAPRPLPDIRPTPPSAISIDVESGQLHAPLGTVEHLAETLLASGKDAVGAQLRLCPARLAQRQRGRRAKQLLRDVAER